MSRLHPLSRSCLVAGAVFQSARGIKRIVMKVSSDYVYYVTTTGREGRIRVAGFLNWAFKREGAR